ncbi:MAG: hypothetical protein OXH11_10460 [Candidatus Aminicenantes bacterium]|nr:hypothetical protein [Candidatus Aminicenantes bacterium]
MAVGRVSFPVSGLGVLVLAIGLSQCRPVGTPPPPSTEVLLPEASFRVRLGLLDEEPGIWSGRLVPVPGQKLELKPDEFRANIYRHSFLDSIHSVDADPQLPNDQIKGDSGWVAATRMSWIRGGKSVLRHPSVIVNVLQNPGDQPIRIETEKGEFIFRPDEIQLFQTDAFLDGAVVVESVPPSSPLASERYDIQDYPSMTSTRSGKLWAAWQEYVEGEADLIVARSRGESGWDPVHLLDEDMDAFRTAVAEDSRGRIWVIWSAQVEGNWDLYARNFDGERWSFRYRLTEHPSPDVYHRAVTDSEGRLWLIWQKTVDGVTRIVARDFDGEYWGEEVRISEGAAAGGNNWWPSVAAGPNGELAVAWDGYASGSYDVYLRLRRSGRWEDVRSVAGTARFEAGASVAMDGKGRTWIAWHESGPQWGKDTGRLVDQSGQSKGTELYETRTLRVACLDDGKWMTTLQDPAVHLGEGKWEMPHLQMDASGHPWLLARHLTMRQSEGRGRYFASWVIACLRYDGSRWTRPTHLFNSSGRNDMMPASALDPEDRVWAVWPTDKRSTKSFLAVHGQVMVGRLGRGEPAPMELSRLQLPPVEPFDPVHPGEDGDLERIRSYRIQSRGRTYSIYRGDLHRHTDISLDGGGDGSLVDAYRYARDAGGLDFLGITDHNHEIVEPYNWWRNQKVADLFQLENFAAFYGYERSLEFPNGHRNVFFIRRGTSILPIETAEHLGLEGSERLFWHLRRKNGTSIPHTIATGSGTDWRDNDPEVEHLLEIFQGMREAYEHPGAPQPMTVQPSSTLEQDNRPFRRLGTAWSALEKGYKLGFIASSDHISTHISYACLIAEELTPEGLLEAIRARRAYAATDNIILDVRFLGSDGEHLMGEAFTSATPVRITADLMGTQPIRRVDVIKDNRIVYSVTPDKRDVKFQYADAASEPGESYYYLRVIQEDGEMAWGSPAWVDHRP